MTFCDNLANCEVEMADIALGLEILAKIPGLDDHFLEISVHCQFLVLSKSSLIAY